MSRTSAANGGTTSPSCKDRIIRKSWKQELAARGEDKRPSPGAASLDEISAMQHIKQDKADVTIAQPGPGYPRKPPTSANDNDCEGSWSHPSPRGLGDNPTHPRFRYEEATPLQAVQTSFRSSWSGTLSRVTYVMGASIAMLGWMYLLCLALLTCVQAIAG